MEATREDISIIRYPLIDNFSRIIKNLAKRGRGEYQNFLIQPLSKWNSAEIPENPLTHLLKVIDSAKKKDSKKLPSLYKSAIIKSVAPDQLDLSIPGNVSIDFLKTMKVSEKVSRSEEALEFVNILRDPFKLFSDKEFMRVNKIFEKEVNSADTSEVKKLLKIREGGTIDKKDMDRHTRESIENIEKLIRKGKMPEIKRAIIVFLLKFSNPAAPNHHLVINSLIEKLEKKNPAFRKEVMDSTAIIIYHETLKAIKENNLPNTVNYISKYAILFRGNPETPNFNEIDSFEKKFFRIIEERNLWDKLEAGDSHEDTY